VALLVAGGQESSILTESGSVGGLLESGEILDNQLGHQVVDLHADRAGQHKVLRIAGAKVHIVDGVVLLEELRFLGIQRGNIELVDDILIFL